MHVDGIDIRAEVFIISIDQSLLVYKVDNPVQSFLLSSLVLNPNTRFHLIKDSKS